MDTQPKKRGIGKMIGYILTAGWIALILAETDGDMAHPLFDYIFIVPLIGWIVVMVLSSVFQVLVKGKDNQ